MDEAQQENRTTEDFVAILNYLESEIVELRSEILGPGDPELRELIDKFDVNPDQKHIIQETMATVKNETGCFSNMESIGLKVADDQPGVIGRLLPKRERRTEPTEFLSGLPIKWRAKIDPGWDGQYSRKGIKVREKPESLDEVFTSLARYGQLPHWITVGAHESFHFYQHKLDRDKTEARTKTLHNSVINEAFARRNADYMFGFSTDEDQARVIRRDLAVYGEEHYSYSSRDLNTDERLEEWTEAFNLLESFYAIGYSAADVAEKLVDSGIEMRKRKREGLAISQADGPK